MVNLWIWYSTLYQLIRLNKLLSLFCLWHQFSPVTQSCPALCDPMDCSTPGFTVHHQLPDLARTQCLSNWWCHPTISSSIVPFSYCIQSFPASWAFPMSQFFASGGLSIGASASASVFPMNIQDWFPLGLTGLISMPSKELSGVFSNNTVQHHQLFGAQLTLWSNFHIYTWLLGKNISLTIQTFVSKAMSLLFNMLSRLFITFLPRGKHLLISRLQSPSALILQAKKIKSVTVSIVSPSICHEVMRPDAMILSFWILSLSMNHLKVLSLL